MSIAESLLPEIDQETATTKRVLERVPEDKLSWKPHEKSFSVGPVGFACGNDPGSNCEPGDSRRGGTAGFVRAK